LRPLGPGSPLRFGRDDMIDCEGRVREGPPFLFWCLVVENRYRGIGCKFAEGMYWKPFRTKRPTMLMRAWRGFKRR
jgi:hypothetical protein